MKFLKGLKRNNNRGWFEQHRAEYEAAKTNVEDVVAALIAAIAAFDPAIKTVAPKDTLFRIYRDVRFAKDKAPYKPHFGAVIVDGGRQSGKSGYYVHIEPGASLLASGLHGLPTKKLNRVRDTIATNGQAFERSIKAASFKKTFGELEGETLKTMPRGYNPESPYAQYLKLKDILATHQLKDNEVTNKNFVTNADNVFKAAKPLSDFLNEGLRT